MTEHGIFTTRAEYVVHLFPLLKRLFIYSVADCRQYIKDHNPPLHAARSKDKDRTVTGYGDLIKQNAPFVRSLTVDDFYLKDWPKRKLNDREAGLIGQKIIKAVLESTGRDVEMVDTPVAQLEKGYDALVGGTKVEFKTEQYDTDNLFVQKSEGGHRPLEGGRYRSMPLKGPLYGAPREQTFEEQRSEILEALEVVAAKVQNLEATVRDLKAPQQDRDMGA